MTTSTMTMMMSRRRTTANSAASAAAHHGDGCTPSKLSTRAASHARMMRGTLREKLVHTLAPRTTRREANAALGALAVRAAGGQGAWGARRGSRAVCCARGLAAPEEDAQALLMEERTIFLGNELNELVAESVVASLLYLDGQRCDKDIKLMINSPGGPVNPAMAVLDAMRYCRSDVSTVAMGLVASSATFALAAGTKGKRLSFPNTRIMIHQPLGDAGGLASEYEVYTNEMMYHKRHMAELFAEMVGKTMEEVDADTDRDKYMSAIDAMEYGIVDEIIGGKEAVHVMPADKAEWVLDYDRWTPDRQYD